MVPDLRIEEHGRIQELTRIQTALAVVGAALAPLPVHGQEVESIEGVLPHDRCPHACSGVVIGRSLQTAPTLDACALVLGETGLDPALDVTSRGLLTTTDHAGSGRVPPLVGELVLTARGHASSCVALLTARGHVSDNLPLLIVRDQEREDDESDVSSRRV